MSDSQRLIDRIVTALDSNRLRADFADALGEEPFSRIEEWAESLTAVAEAISEARDAVESWSHSEYRDEKAAAKDEAVNALITLTEAWNNSPLDLSRLEDWKLDDE